MLKSITIDVVHAPLRMCLEHEGPPTDVGIKKKLILMNLSLLCIEPGSSCAILAWLRILNK